MNTLAGRISELLREERETVADLSHRVRTPLTALRLDAEALPRAEDAATDRGGRGRGAARGHLGDRRRPPARHRRGAGATPPRWSADRVAFWSVLAEDTDRDVRTDVAPGPLPVAVGRADLEALVDALLGNVFAHTPDGTALRRAARRRGRAEGPGCWSPTPVPGCASEPTSCAGARAAAGPPAWASTSPAAPPSRQAADSRWAARRGAGWR